MRLDGPPSSILAGSVGWAPVVSSWLGSTLLAGDVPVLSGALSVNGAQQVPERLTLVVPAVASGHSWVPGLDVAHPLARFGQRLAVSITITASRGRSWQIPLGWFQIQGWQESADGSTVSIEAVGILQRVADDRLATASSPSLTATLAGEFRRLMSGGIPVTIDPGVVDRACPSSFQWDEDRLGALYDLVDAWPARILTGSDGTIHVLPPLTGTPTSVITWTDGAGGVLMSAPASDSRDGIYTSVVVRSSATDAANRAPIQAEAQASPAEYQTWTYGVVRKFYSSPLITTDAQALTTAQAMLADSLRTARQITVTLPPDPRVELGDAVRTIWDGVTRDGWVLGYQMPLTATGGEMSVTVGLTSAAPAPTVTTWTNLISNPSGRRTVTGYVGAGTTAPALDGGAGTYATVTAPASPYIQIGALVIGSRLAPDTTYQFSALVYSSSGTCGVAVSGAMVGGSASAGITTGTYTRVSLTFTTTASGTVYLAISPLGTAIVGTIIAFADAIVQLATAPAPYFDGSTPDSGLWDYAWTGTADASTSTKVQTLP